MDGVDQHVAIGTARPTRDAAHVLRLLRLKLDRLESGLGLEAFVLVAERCEPLAATTVTGGLVGDGPARDVVGMVDVLVGRVGGRNLFRVRPVESHVHERSVARAAALDNVGGWPSWPRPARLLSRP